MKKHTIKQILEASPGWVLGMMRSILILPMRAYFRYVSSPFGKRALYDHVASHLWWLESHVKARTTSGSTVYVDAQEIVGRYIYYFGVWEPNLTSWISRRLKPGDVFIDVGANIGYYSLLASKLVGERGRVVAIEALPQILFRLEANLKMNGACNVRTVNVAAWHKEERVRIFTQPERPAGTTTLMQEWATQWHLAGGGEVSAKPLSSILTPDEAKAARLIKVDVEGAEWNVVSGMASLLPIGRKDVEIIMEISRSMLAAQGKTGQDLLDLFAGWGFHAYHIVNDYSAAAYFARSTPMHPTRIRRFPNGSADQLDLVFSRVDAESV